MVLPCSGREEVVTFLLPINEVPDNAHDERKLGDWFCNGLHGVLYSVAAARSHYSQIKTSTISNSILSVFPIV